MGFNNYFIKVKGIGGVNSDWIFPSDKILLSTYKPLESIQDLDSYRDGNGELQRNVLDHLIYKVEFQLRAMTNTEFDSIMSYITSRYTKPDERKLKIVCYIALTGGYTDPIDVYIPDLEITVKQQIDATTLKYEPITMKFIRY